MTLPAPSWDYTKSVLLTVIASGGSKSLLEGLLKTSRFILLATGEGVPMNLDYTKSVLLILRPHHVESKFMGTPSPVASKIKRDVMKQMGSIHVSIFFNGIDIFDHALCSVIASGGSKSHLLHQAGQMVGITITGCLGE
jgi:hypothetical protein